MNEQTRLRALLVLGCAIGCGGDEGDACLPGDATKPGFVCSPAGEWIPSPPMGTVSQSGQSGGGGSNNAQSATGGTAGIVNGGSQGSNEVPQCLATGELDCSEAALCCDGAMCITDGVSVVCSALCDTNDQCVSGCCARVDETSSACAPARFCPAPDVGCTLNEECDTQCCFQVDAQSSVCAPTALCAPPPSVGCTSLALFANDGTFLGEASSNAFASDSVCNEFGQYGSPFSSTSIYNEFGQYGSPFASLSAYNEFTSTPPVLYCAATDTFLNAVSKNTFVAGAIDPDALCSVLAANGL